MAASGTDNQNKTLAEEWRKVVIEWAGGNAGKRVVFPCIDGTPAPIAGMGVPEAYTNNAVYEVADALMYEDNRYYSSSKEAGYFDQEKSFFEAVVITGDTTPAARAALDDALKRQSEATARFTAIKKDAQKEWKESQEFDPSDYGSWIVNNRPDVANAENDVDGAAATVHACQSRINGPAANELATINGRFQRLFKNESLPGYSFRTAGPGKLKLAEYASKVAAGQNPAEPSEPAGTINMPAYSYPADYSDTVDRLFKQAVENGAAQKHGSISASAQNDSRDSGNRSSTSGGGADFCWLRVQNTTSEKWSNSSVTSSSENITLSYEIKGLEVVPIAPGKWDVPNYRNKYKKANTSGAPDAPQKVVKPSSMLLVSGLKYKVQFGAETRSTFDKEYNSAKKNGGSISIFGITIAFGSPAEENEHQESHTSSYNPSNGELVIEEKPHLGSPRLLAMIGDKFGDA